MGAEIDKQDENNGWTALMMVALNGHTETAIALIGMGAEIDKQANDGCTAIILAAFNGYKETAIKLNGLNERKRTREINDEYEIDRSGADSKKPRVKDPEED